MKTYKYFQNHSLEDIFINSSFNDDEFSSQEKTNMLFNIQARCAQIEANRKRKMFVFLGIAASLLLLACIGLKWLNKPEAQHITSEKANTESSEIQLILANNHSIALENDASINLSTGEIIESDGKRQMDLKEASQSEKLNELIVPEGRHSFIKLEDGTKVWVNAGSRLKFPAKFAEDKREIYIDGEIYIEVSKDKQRPFFVQTHNMDVKVLGTRFNVMSYSEEETSSVVLVEGLVEVRTAHSAMHKVLTPDKMLTLSAKGMDISPVDTYDYISWKDGLLQFKSQPLSTVITRLSRYYNINIDCESDLLPMRCSGKLVLFDDVMTVIETIVRTIPLEKATKNNVPLTYEMGGQHQIIIHRK
ncbi:MAG: FecR domain-containing protein [Prevotella sp.]|nr:FecR domain-containing protein [Prevotella sp.]